jgi:hypothetical protein
MSSKGRLSEEFAAVGDRLAVLLNSASASNLSGSAKKQIEVQLRRFIVELEASLRKLDPVSLPTSVFDPSNPKVVGRFTALALLAQSQVPLSAIGRFYGSGVYAIYYHGDFPLYQPLSRSESPIYVGKAGPAEQSARTALEQGERLAARLNDHRKNIERAKTTLNVADFSARYLVVQSGWETTAESYLIHLFRPIWNSEMNMLYGLGKHGDAATTRANKRSPWDTLHPGRKWAEATLEDGRTITQITADVAAHFAAHPPFLAREALLDTFFEELRQQ